MDEKSIKNLILYYSKDNRFHYKQESSLAFEGKTPGCDDHIVLYFKSESNEKVTVSFTAKSCTLSRACTAILLEQVNQLTLKQIDKLDFSAITSVIGDKMAYSRVTCTRLAFDTLKGAINQILRYEKA
ncbi:iron-sulfur cluster assembly scaffold protein [Fictibacillus sp. B-59209]|uniref:iron-sulfur cluster assembly scaffold protein n=1 Tax=Fictibacillus sp. B-59209 TaxID=3024873 RepID=UPI002E1C1C01|nr:iron-sulfur cluster assembly scaffold protein [Fictibacillus sp. B-59209]